MKSTKIIAFCLALFALALNSISAAAGKPPDSRLSALGNALYFARVAYQNDRIYFCEVSGSELFSANIDGSDRRSFTNPNHLIPPLR